MNNSEPTSSSEPSTNLAVRVMATVNINDQAAPGSRERTDRNPLLNCMSYDEIVNDVENVSKIIASWLLSIHDSFFTRPMLTRIDDLQLFIRKEDSRITELRPRSDIPEQLCECHQHHQNVMVEYSTFRSNHFDMVTAMMRISDSARSDDTGAEAENVEESPEKKARQQVPEGNQPSEAPDENPEEEVAGGRQLSEPPGESQAPFP